MRTHTQANAAVAHEPYVMGTDPELDSFLVRRARSRPLSSVAALPFARPLPSASALRLRASLRAHALEMSCMRARCVGAHAAAGAR
jgi:hypothetical protein